MRSRLLLARAAALVLAVGGLMVIPASPAASVDCNQFPEDQYDNGGINFLVPGVPVRHGSYEVCDVVKVWPDHAPNIFCAKQVVGSPDDWIFFFSSSDIVWGWVRESKVNVHDGDRWVNKCFTGGSEVVHITQHPLQ